MQKWLSGGVKRVENWKKGMTALLFFLLEKIGSRKPKDFYDYEMIRSKNVE